MFVLSFSSKKTKKIAVFVCCLIGFISIFSVVIYRCCIVNEKSENHNLTVNNSAMDLDDILVFISNFGYTVKEEPDEIREVIIPVEFNDVYENYNQIQLRQGYDLRHFAGKRVKRWTFTITDYPGYENKEYIKINILVCDSKVIGGDVCSVKLDGFMHGFLKE